MATAFDTYGRVFLRGVLSEDPSPEVLAAARQLLEAARAGYSLDDVAAELGMRLAVPPPAASVAARRPAARKVRV